MTGKDNQLNSLIGLSHVFSSKTNEQEACWEFCRQMSSIFDVKLPEKIEGMVQTNEPSLHGIVLFQSGNLWHAGFIWPDGLHFIHVIPDAKLRDSATYTIRWERLTLFPWNLLKKEYYVSPDISSPTT